MKKLKSTDYFLVFIFILFALLFSLALFLKKYILILIVIMYLLLLLLGIRLLEKNNEKDQNNKGIIGNFYNYYSQLSSFSIQEISNLEINRSDTEFLSLHQEFISSIKDSNSIFGYIKFLKYLDCNEKEILKNIFLINQKETKNKKELILENKIKLSLKTKENKKQLGFTMVFIALLAILVITIALAKVVIG